MKNRMTALLPFCLSMAAVLAVTATSSYSQNLPFQATYGDSLNEEARAVIATSSGGHIMVGSVITEDFPVSSSDIYVVKISPCGEIEWKKRYDISRQDRGVKIRQTSDGSYLVLGNTEVASPCQNQLDILLMKIDSIGDVQWARTYGGTDYDIGTDLQLADPQGTFSVIVGNTASFGNGGIDGIILFVNQLGYVTMGKTLGGTNNDHFNSCTVANGEVTVAGLTLSSPTPGAGKLLLTKLMLPFGNVVAPFPMVYGNGMDWMTGLSVIRLSNGQLLVGGNRRVGETTGAYLLHTQSNGTYINDRMFSAGPGTYMEFQELREEPAQANSFAAVGVGVDVPGGFGSGDVYFAETDLMLNPTVQMLHGGTGDDAGRSLTRSSTGPGHTIAGYTSSFGFGGSDMYTIQQDMLGVSGCHDASPVVQTSIPRITGTPMAMQLSMVKVGCEQEVATSVYGDRYPLCDQCDPEELRAPGDPGLSSLERQVRTTDMMGR